MPTSEPAVMIDLTDTTAVCVACPHPFGEHDPLSVRYCAATTSGALPRGCICPR